MVFHVFDLIPMPRDLDLRHGTFRFGDVLAVHADPQAAVALTPLLRQIEDGLGIRVEHREHEAGIVVERAGDDADESYLLDITSSGIHIRAGLAGIRHAAQTVRAMLPADSLRVAAGPAGVALPACRIEDAPVHGWRGLMIDVSRHLMPIRWLLRLVEVMAFHKLNVLHLHLTDDQGWRMPVDAFPRLTEVGAYRRETLVGGRHSDRFDGVPYGGHYTKAQLRELVAHASRHGVTVVPEIDMPGHMLAAIASYPQWGNTGRQLEVLTRWAMSHNVMNIEESTLRDLEQVLDEVIDVFDSPWIHLGGDECPRAEWRDSARVSQLMAERGIEDLDGVQAWIMRRLAAHVRARGRIPLCWDEALDAGLDPDVVVMAWRSEDKAVEALRRGHPTVVANQEFFYFDFTQSFDPAEPLGPEPDDFFMTTLEQVHRYRPLDGCQLPAPLGLQAQLWTEFVGDGEKAEYQLFPRLAAFAETAWTGGGGDYAEFLARIPGQVARYEALGLQYRPLDGPGPRWSSRWHGPVPEIASVIAVSDAEIDAAP